MAKVSPTANAASTISPRRTHTLAESKGKRAVVLAWFPKAFTGG